jgi:hypothetical protein
MAVFSEQGRDWRLADGLGRRPERTTGKSLAKPETGR